MNMSYQWNDNSVYFHGQMKYVKGDIIPGNAIPPSLRDQYLRYKKIIPVQPAAAPVKPLERSIKLSISMMGHPSRSQFFPYLKERLGEDVPFSIDQKNCLLENSKASWRLYDPEADFHVVVQDDCVVCNNFKERVIAFINEQEEKRISEKRPIQGYNFFLKNPRTGLQIAPTGGVFFDNVTRAGLAICLPTKIIEAMLVEFDKQTSRHDDDRISMFMKKNGYRMCFPFPSFIDHRVELDSLANNDPGLKAIKFIDDCEVTIPKIIHQLWVGPNPAPVKWMNSWKEKNPGWEYRLWDEKAIKKTKWINQKHIDFYMKQGNWPGVSDVCTYEILYNHGGFMPGADSVCQLPIDDLFFEDYDAYGCYEQERIRPGLISPLCASVKGGRFAKELIGGLFMLSEVGEPWKCTGNLYMGEMFKRTKQKVKVFPSYYMNPEHFTGEKYTGFGRIYAQQMWGSTLSKTNKCNAYQDGVA
jgi:hypothetical protein